MPPLALLIQFCRTGTQCKLDLPSARADVLDSTYIPDWDLVSWYCHHTNQRVCFILSVMWPYPYSQPQRALQSFHNFDFSHVSQPARPGPTERCTADRKMVLDSKVPTKHSHSGADKQDLVPPWADKHNLGRHHARHEGGRLAVRCSRIRCLRDVGGITSYL